MTAKPTTVSRSEWGAAAPNGSMTALGSITKILVHHTDGNQGATGSAAYTAVKDIQYGHMNYKKWSDIGYHFLISADGLIFEGRSMAYQGAHCAANSGNVNSIGISLIGSFNNTYITDAQETSLVKLLAWLKTNYSVSSYNDIKGHRDFESTDCPGNQVYSNLQNIRNKVAAYILGI